ncbi:MAG: uracil-DNA glycosylase [Chloroflexota bacterium]
MEEQDRARLLEETRAQALVCQRCHLWETRTQVVFGEGNIDAEIMLVGEGPGETEDKKGHPFVGRAGALLNRALAAVGLDRDSLWVTNLVRSRPVAVKDGKLRNRAPLAGEVAACTIWMESELAIVHPRLLVCLGAVPGHYLIHKNFRLNAERGQVFEVNGNRRLATFHPAYILRLQGDAYDRTLAMLQEDLRLAMAEAKK